MGRAEAGPLVQPGQALDAGYRAGREAPGPGIGVGSWPSSRVLAGGFSLSPFSPRSRSSPERRVAPTPRPESPSTSFPSTRTCSRTRPTRVTGGTIPANSTSRATIDVTAWSNTVRLYYDHWENGYALDPVTLTGADEVYELNVGQTLTFLSAAIPRPRTGADGNTYIGERGQLHRPAPRRTVISRTDTQLLLRRPGPLRHRRRRHDGDARWLARRDRTSTPPSARRSTRSRPSSSSTSSPSARTRRGVDYNRVWRSSRRPRTTRRFRSTSTATAPTTCFNTENGYRTARTTPTAQLA